MASLVREIVTRARPGEAWDAIRDIGALHTRLVPGFVVDTRLEPGARIVTFANGTVLREPIVALDEGSRRLVWSAEGGRMTHYNAAVQVHDDPAGARIVWTADFLPDSLGDDLAAAMAAGMAAMQTALDRLAPPIAAAPAKIARIWRGVAKPENADAYEAMLKPEPLPGIGRAPGYQGSYVLKRSIGEEIEFVTILLWESIEAIRAAAGADYETAIVPEARRRYLKRYDPTAAHYEIAATHGLPSR
ncbi:MAG TPA: SRPBCC family protein [Roseiarcus sp.]|jgi:heme-degrading monooxygenase HmoA